MEVRIPSDRSLFPSDLSLAQDPARWPWRRAPGGASRTFPAARFRREAAGLRLKAHEDGCLAVGLFDTFDWGILRAGSVLLQVRRDAQGSGELVLIPSEIQKPKSASKVAAALTAEAGPYGRIGWFCIRAERPHGWAY